MNVLKNYFRKLLIRLGNSLNYGLIVIFNWEARNRIMSSERYMEESRLLKHGYKVYSQHDEDGIIDEIFKRIGYKNRFFVECGAGNGLENNTLFLLLQGWKGLWIEGNAKNYKFIEKKFSTLIKTNQLIVDNQFITKENINNILGKHNIPQEIDLLSIDIDGNDYHIFKNIQAVSARVVVIEYNAKFPPHVSWVMKYNPDHVWDRSDYYGASLKSLEYLFSEKGYSLVGANISGTNAFFVRNDLVSDKFCPPFSAENHYEPARHWLSLGWVSGNKPNFGDFERV
jgi:hypothetical protein